MGREVDIMNPFEKSKRAVHPGESAVRQYAWENVADLTVAEAALAVDERNSVYINALGTTKAGIYSPKNGQVAFEIRLRSDGTGTADPSVIEMYFASKDIVADLYHYRRLATMTFKQGTGEYWPSAVDPNPATIFFADELAITNEPVWITTEVDTGLDASEGIATYALNLHGTAKVAFIMSTKDEHVTHAYIDVRRF